MFSSCGAHRSWTCPDHGIPDHTDLGPFLDFGERIRTRRRSPCPPQGISLNVTSACNLGLCLLLRGPREFRGASAGR